MEQLTTPFTSWLHNIHVHIELQKKAQPQEAANPTWGKEKKN
jgi:hypothetical protein